MIIMAVNEQFRFKSIKRTMYIPRVEIITLKPLIPLLWL